MTLLWDIPAEQVKPVSLLTASLISLVKTAATANN